MTHLRYLGAVCLLASPTIAAAADTTFTWTENREFGSGTLTASYQGGDEYLVTAMTGDLGNLGGIT
jgi:hypothetical protein